MRVHSLIGITFKHLSLCVDGNAFIFSSVSALTLSHGWLCGLLIIPHIIPGPILPLYKEYEDIHCSGSPVPSA